MLPHEPVTTHNFPNIVYFRIIVSSVSLAHCDWQMPQWKWRKGPAPCRPYTRKTHRALQRKVVHLFAERCGCLNTVRDYEFSGYHTQHFIHCMIRPLDTRRIVSCFPGELQQTVNEVRRISEQKISKSP